MVLRVFKSSAWGGGQVASDVRGGKQFATGGSNLRAGLAGLWLLLGVQMFAHAHDAVTVQLKWRHQFQFAGYYAALEKGFYRDAGLDVTLVEGSPRSDTIEEVVSGRSQYGIAASDLLLARSRAEVVALAAIFQHSPFILLGDARRVANLHELAGQKVMVEPHAEELYAYLRSEMLPAEKLIILPHTQNPQDILDGHVVAMSSYSTTAPYWLRLAGVPTIEFSPRAGGIDFYGDVLFTLEDEVRNHPERVKAFREATLKGWVYAMRHQDEIIALILAKYNTQNIDRGFLQFEAHRIGQLMQTDLVEIGHMNPGRWQHIAQTYASLGMKSDDDVPAGFLYDDRPEPVPPWVYRGGAMVVLLAMIFSWLARRNVILNRKLRCEVAAHVEANRQLAEKVRENQELQDQLRDQAVRDPLTGLHNRRYLDETLPRELARARRDRYPLAVVVVDLDHFKQINDRYGHSSGDAVLCVLAAILREGTRLGDIVCRHGGEEFVVVLPGMTLQDAARRADEWRAELAHTPVHHHHLDIAVTLSAGVAAYPTHGSAMDALIDYADDALYRAKQSGRNRVMCYEPGHASRPALTLVTADGPAA